MYSTDRLPELKSWLFYYPLPVLSGILPDLYFNHLSHLVAGVHLLSAPSLSSDDLSTAETALVAFYDEFGDLHGMSIPRRRYSTPILHVGQ